MLKGLIFAGNGQEAKMFQVARGLDPKEWRYITTPESIMGLHKVDFVKLSGAVRHPRAFEIARELTVIGLDGGTMRNPDEFDPDPRISEGASKR